MKAPVYTQSGEKKGEMELKKEIFEAPIKPDLMHQAFVRQISNARIDTAKTLTRAEVRGGGRKPFPQKGRGRARQGSIRSPLWRGGGVPFGPTGTKNFEKRMPKKMRRAALFSALSVKASEKDVLVLQSFELTKPKTTVFTGLMKKIPLKRKILFVIPESNLIIEKSVSNIPGVKTIHVSYLNIADILWSDSLLILESSLKIAEELFLNSPQK